MKNKLKLLAVAVINMVIMILLFCLPILSVQKNGSHSYKNLIYWYYESAIPVLIFVVLIMLFTLIWMFLFLGNKNLKVPPNILFMAPAIIVIVYIIGLSFTLTNYKLFTTLGGTSGISGQQIKITFWGYVLMILSLCGSALTNNCFKTLNNS